MPLDPDLKMVGHTADGNNNAPDSQISNKPRSHTACYEIEAQHIRRPRWSIFTIAV